MNSYDCPILAQRPYQIVHMTCYMYNVILFTSNIILYKLYVSEYIYRRCCSYRQIDRIQLAFLLQCIFYRFKHPTYRRTRIFAPIYIKNPHFFRARKKEVAFTNITIGINVNKRPMPPSAVSSNADIAATRNSM